MPVAIPWLKAHGDPSPNWINTPGDSQAALPKVRYRRAFEPGSAIGILSERLASRCDELVSIELMPRIAERARVRLGSRANVSVSVRSIPDVWPTGTFDLIVLSEVLITSPKRV